MTQIVLLNNNKIGIISNVVWLKVANISIIGLVFKLVLFVLMFLNFCFLFNDLANLGNLLIISLSSSWRNPSLLIFRLVIS